MRRSSSGACRHLAEREPTAVSFVIFGTLLWDCVVGALMLLIAFSTFLVMLLAAVVLVWFIHQL